MSLSPNREWGDRWSMIRRECLAELLEMAPRSVDAIVTDPPYSSGGFTRGDRMAAPSTKYVTNDTIIRRPEFAGDNRDQRSFTYWVQLWMSECLRIAVPGAPFVVFTDWRQLPATTDAIQAAGWVWRGIVVWDKTEAARPQRGRFKAQCEYAVWGTAGASPDLEEVGCLPGALHEPDELPPCIEAGNRDDKHHMAGKPTKVMQHLVRICRPEGLVLDPFAGSGSTGIAALIEGRRFLGIEQTEDNFRIACHRLSAQAAQVGLAEYRRGQLGLLL